MTEYMPILIVGGIIGVFAAMFLIALAALRRHKEHFDDRERSMADSEIIRRLLAYGKPYWKSFVLVFFIMLISIAHPEFREELIRAAERQKIWRSSNKR